MNFSDTAEIVQHTTRSIAKRNRRKRFPYIGGAVVVSRNQLFSVQSLFIFYLCVINTKDYDESKENNVIIRKEIGIYIELVVRKEDTTWSQGWVL